MPKDNVPTEIQRELDMLPTDVWSIENGSRHRKIFVDRRLVGTLPHGRVDSSAPGSRNVLAQVRRARKQFEGRG